MRLRRALPFGKRIAGDRNHAVAFDDAPGCLLVRGELKPAHGLLARSLFLYRRRSRRTLTHDQEYGVLVLGAVPMHLLAEMSEEAADRHRRGVRGIEFR